MAKYEQLREHFGLPHRERAALAQRELQATLDAAGPALAEIAGAGAAQIQAALGPRADELVEIAVEASAGLARQLAQLAPDGSSVDDDERMRDVRHDLRGPVGTMRGALSMLTRRMPDPQSRLAALARELGQAAEDLRDIIDALMEDEDRE